MFLIAEMMYIRILNYKLFAKEKEVPRKNMGNFRDVLTDWDLFLILTVLLFFPVLPVLYATYFSLSLRVLRILADRIFLRVEEISAG